MKKSNKMERIKEELARAIKLFYLSYMQFKEGEEDDWDREALKELNGTGLSSLVMYIVGMVAYLKEGNVLDHKDARDFMSILSDLDISFIDEIDLESMDDIMMDVRNEDFEA